MFGMLLIFKGFFSNVLLLLLLFTFRPYAFKDILSKLTSSEVFQSNSCIKYIKSVRSDIGASSCLEMFVEMLI